MSLTPKLETEVVRASEAVAFPETREFNFEQLKHLLQAVGLPNILEEGFEEVTNRGGLVTTRDTSRVNSEILTLIRMLNLVELTKRSEPVRLLEVNNGSSHVEPQRSAFGIHPLGSSIPQGVQYPGKERHEGIILPMTDQERYEEMAMQMLFVKPAKRRAQEIEENSRLGLLNPNPIGNPKPLGQRKVFNAKAALAAGLRAGLQSLLRRGGR